MITGTLSNQSWNLYSGMNLMGSSWCVNCYPENKVSCFLYRGNSLCRDCFVKNINNKDIVKDTLIE